MRGTKTGRIFVRVWLSRDQRTRAAENCSNSFLQTWFLGRQTRIVMPFGNQVSRCVSVSPYISQKRRSTFLTLRFDISAQHKRDGERPAGGHHGLWQLAGYHSCFAFFRKAPKMPITSYISLRYWQNVNTAEVHTWQKNLPTLFMWRWCFPPWVAFPSSSLRPRWEVLRASRGSRSGFPDSATRSRPGRACLRLPVPNTASCDHRPVLAPACSPRAVSSQCKNARGCLTTGVWHSESMQWPQSCVFVRNFSLFTFLFWYQINLNVTLFTRKMVPVLFRRLPLCYFRFATSAFMSVVEHVAGATLKVINTTLRRATEPFNFVQIRTENRSPLRQGTPADWLVVHNTSSRRGESARIRLNQTRETVFMDMEICADLTCTRI